MKTKSLHLFLIFLISTNVAFSKADLNAPLFNNLGDFHFSISTHEPLAQRFFDQGMVLYYGFEWGESIRSFKEAARLDPSCGMCYWGVALATGAKMNAPMTGHEYHDAKSAIKKALSLSKNETPAEQAYIQALSVRFQHEPKAATSTASVFSCHFSDASLDVSSKKELATYAEAMKKITEKFPADNNAKALYAYALFDTIKWKFWDENQKINPMTSAVIRTLKDILSSDSLHIGGNHYYIHVIEQSPQPEIALENANRLKTLVPGSEHLVHMPTHIYFLTGRYHEGTDSNLQAVDAFKTYNKECLDQGFQPEINYLYFHNYDFLRTTAAMEGRQHLALSAAREMLRVPFPAWLSHESSLQWFIPIPLFVEARFGMWDDILKESQPNQKYQYALGMWHYARGLAFAELNQTKKAKQESAALKKIIAKGPDNQHLEKGGIQLLTLADSILKAVMADREKNEKQTFFYLKKADKIQHDMGYHEPPDWYFPVKEIVADAYLKWGHPQQAIEMYELELKQYPKNGWALFGLEKSQRQLGKTKEADRVRDQFKEAWKYADISEPVSLFLNH